MDESTAVESLGALAQPTRLAVFRHLVRTHPEPVAAGELARLFGAPHNTMSTHLAILARARLVTALRQGRSILYGADLDGFRGLVAFLTRDCCGGRPEICASILPSPSECQPGAPPVTDRPYNVLFLCTGNTARSILAESILRKDGAGRFNAFSAGSHPKGTVNPFALKVLAAADYPADGVSSKSWDVFAGPGAPAMDFVFTVCDDAAGESCPVWPGHPMTAHWGVEDPAAVEGTDIEKERAFVQAFRYLKNRISAFVNLPKAALDRMAIERQIAEIGLMEGAGRPEREERESRHPA